MIRECMTMAIEVGFGIEDIGRRSGDLVTEGVGIGVELVEGVELPLVRVVIGCLSVEQAEDVYEAVVAALRSGRLELSLDEE